MKYLLSKSKYLIGLQCPRYLWTAFHDKERIPEPDEARKHIFEQGYLVGELAKKWFSDGIDISCEPNEFIKNIEETEKLIYRKERKPLFEAGIKVELEEGFIYSRADVLVPIGQDLWDIVEVKSSTKLKPENVDDVSFQKHVYEKAGLKIRKCFLMYVDNEYVKKGEIDVKKILKTEDITEKVEKKAIGIEERIDNIFKIINAKKCPEVAIGHHCKKPYECPLADCWDFIPADSVFDLYYGGKKCFELFEKDIQLLKDVPPEFKLTKEQQKIQINCAKTNKPNINKENIGKFLGKLKYPLYYFDFETISTAIPLFDNSHPYQQVPFQYSLHVQEKSNEKPKHVSFLAKGDEDPRKELLKSLKENLGKNGSIVVYYESFEKSVLKKLEMIFPKEGEWIESIIQRIIDLFEPFGEFDYYHPSQKGSASIKAVMPALIPKLPKGIKSYKEMEIGKGDVASLAFLQIALGEHPDFSDVKVTPDKVEKVRAQLEEYCELDTLGEVLIVGALGKMVGGKGR